MLRLAGQVASLDQARVRARAALDDGSALAAFRALVVAQGGDGAQVDDPDRLPQAPLVEPLIAPCGGAVAAIDTGAVGWASVRLGAGRLAKGAPIDHAVGLVLLVKVGQVVQAGEPLGEIHAQGPEQAAEARAMLLDALSFSDRPVEPLPRFYGTVG